MKHITLQIAGAYTCNGHTFVQLNNGTSLLAEVKENPEVHPFNGKIAIFKVKTLTIEIAGETISLKLPKEFIKYIPERKLSMLSMKDILR